MRDLIDALYAYAQENRVPGYLETKKYRKASYDLEKGWDAFRSTLTAEQGHELDTLLFRERKMDLLADEAGFLAGIAIGLDLGRL